MLNENAQSEFFVVAFYSSIFISDSWGLDAHLSRLFFHRQPGNSERIIWYVVLSFRLSEICAHSMVSIFVFESIVYVRDNDNENVFPFWVFTASFSVSKHRRISSHRNFLLCDIIWWSCLMAVMWYRRSNDSYPNSGSDIIEATHLAFCCIRRTDSDWICVMIQSSSEHCDWRFHENSLCARFQRWIVIGWWTSDNLFGPRSQLSQWMYPHTDGRTASNKIIDQDLRQCTLYWSLGIIVNIVNIVNIVIITSKSQRTNAYAVWPQIGVDGEKERKYTNKLGLNKWLTVWFESRARLHRLNTHTKLITLRTRHAHEQHRTKPLLC